VPDRRERSFFLPFMLASGLLALAGLAAVAVPLRECSRCVGTGRAFWNKWDSTCVSCKGRGRVPLADLNSWSR
jgi:hypothetical protein